MVKVWDAMHDLYALQQTDFVLSQWLIQGTIRDKTCLAVCCFYPKYLMYIALRKENFLCAFVYNLWMMSWQKVSHACCKQEGKYALCSQITLGWIFSYDSVLNSHDCKGILRNWYVCECIHCSQCKYMSYNCCFQLNFCCYKTTTNKAIFKALHMNNNLRQTIHDSS